MNPKGQPQSDAVSQLDAMLAKHHGFEVKHLLGDAATARAEAQWHDGSTLVTEQELIDLAWVAGRAHRCGAVTLFCVRDHSHKDGGWSSAYHAAYGAHTCILDQIDLSDAWESEEGDEPPDCEFSLVLCLVEVDTSEDGHDIYLRFVAAAQIDIHRQESK